MYYTMNNETAEKCMILKNSIKVTADQLKPGDVIWFSGYRVLIASIEQHAPYRVFGNWVVYNGREQPPIHMFCTHYGNELFTSEITLYTDEPVCKHHKLMTQQCTACLREENEKWRADNGDF